MKKFFALFMLFICFAFAVNAQEEPPLPDCTDPLGTDLKTLDPGLVPMFVNDLPVIKDLGLRIDMTQQKSSKIRVTM